MTKRSCFRMFAVSDFYLVQTFSASPFFEPSATFRLLLCLGYPSCCECSQVKTILQNSFAYVSWNFTSFMESDMCLSSTVPPPPPPPPQKAVCFFLTKMGQAGSDQLQSWHFQLVSIIPSAKTVVWNAVCFIYMASQHGFFRKLSPRKHTEMKLLTFELHFFQGTIDNITFFKMSNNHMADDVNTILCVVIG